MSKAGKSWMIVLKIWGVLGIIDRIFIIRLPSYTNVFERGVTLFATNLHHFWDFIDWSSTCIARLSNRSLAPGICAFVIAVGRNRLPALISKLSNRPKTDHQGPSKMSDIWCTTINMFWLDAFGRNQAHVIQKRWKNEKWRIGMTLRFTWRYFCIWMSQCRTDLWAHNFACKPKFAKDEGSHGSRRTKL